ncbi:hypothetical protein [Paraliomyxa miuraensis]|uniref:hypothetical protein n=1 Tax=Paraliomyxa miuraensis TaxID=376150 RepID=UPI00225A5C39|nr:hypothetical protein [Paraliomyxa miuraensis]MCX4239160.1 hypothetical protein [Paraliomyxa miuraensis]
MSHSDEAHESLTLEDQALVAELHHLAAALRKSPAQLLADSVRQNLHSLRAAAIPEPTPGTIETFVGSDDRREAEKLAVATALLLRSPSEGEPPFMDRSEFGQATMRLVRVGAHMLADEQLRAFYKEAHQRNATWASFPQELQDLALGFDDSQAVAPLAMFEPSAMELTVTFNVHGRFGFPEDRVVEPFGGATHIRLIAGRSRVQDSGASELIGVEVTVPINPGHPLRPKGLIDNTFGGPYWLPHLIVDEQRRCSRSPELDQAIEILDHMVSVLRLTGRRVAFEPYAGDLGPPWVMWLVLRFPDQTVIRRVVHGLYGFMTTAAMSHKELLDGLPLEQRLFADSWEKARDICAVLAEAGSVRLFEQFRRNALVLESRFNGPSEHDPRVRTLGRAANKLAFRSFVERIWREQPAPEDFAPTDEGFPMTSNDLPRTAEEIIEAIPRLRNEASHCARWDEDGNGLAGDEYGLRVHDVKHRERFARMFPISRRLALGVLIDLVPAFRERTEADLRTLLDLWFSEDFSTDVHLRRTQARLILRRARVEKESDPRLQRFLAERVREREPSEGPALAELCPAVGGEALDALFESLAHEPLDSLSWSAVRSLLHAETTRQRLESILPTLPKAVAQFKEQTDRDSHE